METCKYCLHPNTEQFCAKCGNAQMIKKIDSHYIRHELLHLFHIEKGFLFTIKQMIFSPGIAVKEYLTENRTKLMKPIPFLVLCSLIYSIVLSFTAAENSYESFVQIKGGQNNYFSKSWNWLINHLSYSNILMSGFVGFYVWLFFIKKKYGFFEIMTLICFVIGQGLILLSLKKIVFSIIVYSPAAKLTTVFIFFIYSAWAIGQFFKPKSFLAFFIAIFAYVFGWFTFIIVTVLFSFLAQYLTTTFCSG